MKDNVCTWGKPKNTGIRLWGDHFTLGCCQKQNDFSKIRKNSSIQEEGVRVLGIETSCDETGLALYDSAQGLMGHTVYSQIPIHAEYGGVVPELASRDHVRRLAPLLRNLLAQTGVARTSIDAVAYTRGPGLLGALLVGAAFARSLAFSLQVPALGVHHLEAHLLAPMLEDPAPPFPFIALLVSGGHTQFFLVNGLGDYRLLGQSLDDAAGEAFDKTARMLGLPYPGGRELAELAEEGYPFSYDLPRPMLDRPGLDMSFSGLKTAALTVIRQANIQQRAVRADIAAAFQQAVIDTLVAKTLRAMEETGVARLVAAGGVSANTLLRTRLREEATRLGGEVFFPRGEFCTDNGAMIAYSGWVRLCAGERDDLGFNPKARWPMSGLQQPGTAMV